MHLGDANDLELLDGAFDAFKREDERPTLIVVDSHIGYGAPDVQDTAKAHGEPLGEEEVRLAKRSYGWPEDAQFLIPDGVVEHFAAGDRRPRARAARGLGAALRALSRRAPRARGRSRAHAAARAAGGLGPRHPQLPGGREGCRDALGVRGRR